MKKFLEENPIRLADTQHCLVLEREDGTLVRLITTYVGQVYSKKTDSFTHQTDQYALVKRRGERQKVFTPTTNPDKSLDGMSVEEYIKGGRIGLISVVRPHEMIHARKALLEKLAISN